MKLQIKNKNREVLGTLNFPNLLENAFSAPFNDELKQFILISVENKIPVNQEIYNEKEKNFTLFKKESDETDQLFPLALRNFLVKHGYIIEIDGDEIDKRIMDRISLLSDTDEDRVNLIKKMPQLSYLEKTYILAELEKALKESVKTI